MQFRERAQKLCNFECFKIVCYCSFNLRIPFRKETKTLALKCQVISSDSRMSAVGEFIRRPFVPSISPVLVPRAPYYYLMSLIDVNYYLLTECDAVMTCYLNTDCQKGES